MTSDTDTRRWACGGFGCDTGVITGNHTDLAAHISACHPDVYGMLFTDADGGRPVIVVAQKTPAPEDNT